ncbi:MAG TPA: hypothetical protein VKQ06_09895, partial [Gammaproteobacteria bacterium]|nr:hypothetical protein [Gammaproteobacteria bacterium]
MLPAGSIGSASRVAFTARVMMEIAMSGASRCLILVVLSSLMNVPGQVLAQDLRYPETRQVDVVDDFFGTDVADPYRWLEDDVRESQDVRRWVTAQNEVTFGYLDGLESRDRIRARLTELVNYERYASPFLEADYYYYLRNDGLQNQSVLYRVATLDGEPELVIDPNRWSEDGTVALQGVEISDDGRYMTYARSVAGSDWTEWFVRDMRTGEDLADHIEWTKFSGASWAKDGAGFYYSRFDEPADGAAFQALNTNQKVFYHRIGTPQSQDRLVHARPDHPTWGFDAVVSDDGRYLVLLVYEGTDPRNRVYYIDLDDGELGDGD